MLYHVAISGDLIVADALKALLPPNTKDFNQATREPPLRVTVIYP